MLFNGSGDLWQQKLVHILRRNIRYIYLPVYQTANPFGGVLHSQLFPVQVPEVECGLVQALLHGIPNIG